MAPPHFPDAHYIMILPLEGILIIYDHVMDKQDAGTTKGDHSEHSVDVK